MAFFDNYQDHTDEREGERQGSITRRALIFICRTMDATIDIPKGELDFNWFHDNYPNFPVRLDAKHVEINIYRMFKAMTKTPLWIAYMEMLETSSATYKGLVVPVPNLSMFIVHNAWYLPQSAGATRITRQANSEEKGIIFEPLSSFMESVRLSGCP